MVSISGTTAAAQIRDFERQMRDVAQEKIPRGVQFALNGVSIHASKKMSEILPTVLDDPTPWVRKAFVAKKGDLKTANLRDVKSSLEVKPEQSSVIKYLYGGDQGMERLPGDVGPADKNILIPMWPALQRRTKSKPNKSHDLNKKALSRIIPGTGTVGGVFWGSPNIGGRRRPYGLYARPDPVGRGLPTLLLLALKRVVHPDKLTKPTNRVAEEAMATLPRRLETELASQIARRAARTSGGSAP